MNNLTYEEEQQLSDLKKELNKLLNSFSIFEYVLKWILSFVFLVIAFVVLAYLGAPIYVKFQPFGDIALIVIICIVGYFISKITSKYEIVQVRGESDKEISFKAVILMEDCIYIYEQSHSKIRISESKKGGNIHIYNKFVSYFPRMASFKLKLLSKMKWE